MAAGRSKSPMRRSANDAGTGWTRREVLRSGAVALSGLAAGCATPVPTDPSRSLIDAHAHVWSDDQVRYPVVPHMELKPPAFPADLALRFAEQDGIGRVVLVQPSCYDLDHRYLRACMADSPGRFAAVGLVDWKGDPVAGLVELHAWGFRGVRLQALHRKFHRWVDWPLMDEFWERSADLGMTVCILPDRGVLPVIAEMCRRHPRTRVVLDHFGWVGAGHLPSDREIDAVCAMAELPELRVKLSRLHGFGRHKPPYDDAVHTVERTLAAFGPERCMWGSDMPGQVMHGNSYHDALELVRSRAGLSEGDLDQVLRRTAEELFFA